jgi:hypothetical protein
MERYSFEEMLKEGRVYPMSGGKIELPSIPKGNYSICISAPSWARSCSAPIEVGENKKSLITLQPKIGADLRLTVKKGDTGEIIPYPVFKLRNDTTNEEVDTWAYRSREPITSAPPQTFLTSLPEGSYSMTLGVPRGYGSRGKEPLPALLSADIPQEKTYPEKIIKFTIDARTPEILDLGTVELWPK